MVDWLTYYNKEAFKMILNRFEKSKVSVEDFLSLKAPKLFHLRLHPHLFEDFQYY